MSSDMTTPVNFNNYIVYLRTLQTGPIKNMLDPVKEFFQDIQLKVSAKGITVFEVDASKTALVNITLCQEAFEEFYCARDTLLGVNVILLEKIFKNMDNNDVLILAVEERQPDILLIEICRSESGKTTRVEFKLMDLLFHVPPQQELRYDISLTMSANDLNKICREFKNYSAEHIEIIYCDYQIQFKCKTDRLTIEQNIRLIKNSVNPTSRMHQSSIVSGVFKLDYFIAFTKGNSLTNDVIIHIANDNLLFLIYKIGRIGEIKFGISPKHEEPTH